MSLESVGQFCCSELDLMGLTQWMVSPVLARQLPRSYKDFLTCMEPRQEQLG